MEKKSSLKSCKFFTALFAFACILFISTSSASAAKLSQHEKEQLHQQYIEILEEVKYTVPWGDGLVDIEVSPIDSFEEEDWVSLEEFKIRAIDRIQASIVVENPVYNFEDAAWGSVEDWILPEIVNQQADEMIQAEEVVAPSNSIKNKNTPSAAKLSQHEKEQLHQQYIKILEEVKYTVPWGNGLVDIEVSPIDLFEEEDWVSLEEFKQRAIDRIQANVVVENPVYDFQEDWISKAVLNQQATAATPANAIATLSNAITPSSTTSASRKVKVMHDSTTVDITVSATFTTQLAGNRQIFASYSNLRTTASEGDFYRTGVNARITGLGSTYAFTIGGRLTYVGFTSYHTLNTNFICLPTGVVL